MPHIKGEVSIDVYNALEQTNPGDALVVFGSGAKLSLPDGAKVIDHPIKSSPRGLDQILNIISPSVEDTALVVVPDPKGKETPVTKEFEDVFIGHNLESRQIPWYSSDNTIDDGFSSYATHNKSESLFVKTLDPRAFSCARFIVGQTVDEPEDHPVLLSDYYQAADDLGIGEVIVRSTWRRIISCARVYDRAIRSHTQRLSDHSLNQEKVDNLPSWAIELLFPGKDERDGHSYKALNYAYNRGLLHLLNGHGIVADELVRKTLLVSKARNDESTE